MLMKIYLKRSIKGPTLVVQRHIDRAERIRDAIKTRFGEGDSNAFQHPQQFKLKHFQWFLEEATKDFRPSTRYDYYLTMRILAKKMGKWRDWRKQLTNGPWVRPKESKVVGTKKST